MSPAMKPSQSARAVRAMLRGKFYPAVQPLTEVVPAAAGVNVVRDGGQSLTERSDEPSSRLVNLLEQQNPRSITVEAEALRIQKLMKSATGIRSLIRSR